MKFDMHCHTKEGSLDGKVPVEEFIDILRRKGFDGMLISDHNSYNGYRYWQKHIKGRRFKDFTVLKGIEYDTIDAGHILVIMPEHVKLRILELRGLPVQFLIDIVHSAGGILGPAHPCGEKYLSITNTRKHRNQLAVMDRFDFIEGFNACEEPQSNRRAREIAECYGKPVFGGSDAHKADCIGLGATEFAGKITCESDLIALVKTKGRQACSCGGSYYTKTTKNKIGRANNLLVQSFWFYNRFGSMWNHHKRLSELKRLYIRIK
ncbi:MAG: CehA/McbA family metallohydrolase [bacterium]|nr:CehA/McbA family metallohydrolase [bacterium]